MRTRNQLILLLLFSLLLGRAAGSTQPSAEALGNTKLVLAFYYAWFDPSSFGPGKTPFQPINPYYSTSESTILRHVQTAKSAGIDALVQSWYGPNPNQQTEPNFKTLLNISQQNGFKAAIDFEVASPFFGGNQDRINALRALLNTHAQHPAYLKVDGKPVIFFWANWILPVEDWRYIRQQADPWNQAIWIGEGGHAEYLEVFDGLHLYNVAWSAAPGGVNATWASRTRAKADELGTFKYWVGTAMPGFNNSNVPGVEHTIRNRNNGQYLRDSFNGAAATNPDMLILTSFNEWPEGSGIEPSHQYGNTYINLMAQLSAAYKGMSAASFPPIPVWYAQAEPTAVPPPTEVPTAVPTNTPWPTNTPRTQTQAQPPVAAPQQAQSNAPATDVDTAPAAVPQSNPTPAAVAQIEPQPLPTPLETGEILYIVEDGDSLISIATKFGLSLDELLARTGLTADSALKVGQRIVFSPADDDAAATESEPAAEPTPIPTATALPEPTIDLFRSTPTPGPNGDIVYIIQPGDTLVGVATRFGYTLDQLNELYALNDLAADSILSVGQEIVLGTDRTAVVPLEGNIPPRYAGATYREDDNTFVHTVQAGDTLIGIAVQYDYETMDDFYEVSGLTNESLISVGQEVIVGFKPQPTVTGGSADPPTETPLPPPPPTETPTATPIPTNTPIPFPSLEPTNTLPPPIDATDTPAPEAVAAVDPSTNATDTSSNVSDSSSLVPAFIGLFGSLVIVVAIGWYLWFGRHNT